MRILYIAQRVPYPPDRGDKIATYNQILHLSRRHEVAVACLADGEADLANVGPLAALTSSVDAIPVHTGAARLRALAALMRGEPFTKGYFNEGALHQKIAKRINEKPFDAIVVYSSGVAQFAEVFPRIPRILQFGDLDSLKWEQYGRNFPFPLSWLYAREHRLLLEYERQLAKTFTHSVVHTAAELRDFQRLIPGTPVSCVSNGVDLEYFKPGACKKVPNQLIFTGVMDYFPNIEGIVWFCEEVLPLIQRELPDMTLIICGSRPTPQVRALGQLRGVTVTGYVPDVRPYMEQSYLCVVPLRIARGIQNKLLEAMAMGLPTVTCSASFSGVEAVPGRDLEVADDAMTFASAALRLLRDHGLRRQMGRSARICVEDLYSWDRQLERLDQVLVSVSRPRLSENAVAAIGKQGLGPVKTGHNMKVLFITHRFPYPPARGGKIRPFNIIKHLTTRGHRVTVASVARTAEEAMEGKGIAPFCHDFHVTTIPNTSAIAQMVVRLPTTIPSAMGYFHSPKLASWIQDRLQSERFDLVFVHCAFMAPYVAGIRGTRKILDFGDMDSQKWREYAQVRHFPISTGYWLEWKKMERAEARLASQFDLCTCTTPAELETLRSFGVAGATGWFPNGVDLDYFSPTNTEYKRDSLCFVGRMDYYPNEACMLEFCKITLPKIRARKPEATLTIIGADPPPTIRALAQIPGVTVTGLVPDVRPYVQRAAVSVAPLDIARGTQNKILETMAMGVPTVASVKAAGGVDAEPEKHFLAGGTSDEFAAAVLRVLENPAERERLSIAGRQRMESNHSWARSMAMLDKLIAN